MGVLETILIVLEAICSLALIVIVLLQSGKEAGLSGALTGGSESYLSKNKRGSLDQMLASSPMWLAMAWVLLTLALSLVKHLIKAAADGFRSRFFCSQFR